MHLWCISYYWVIIILFIIFKRLTFHNSCIGDFSIIALYRIIPRTENASLADIERHFTNKQHKWTDWNIVPYTSTDK